MFYSIFLIMFGVYIEQEYRLPSIKIIGNKCIDYLKTTPVPNEKNNFLKKVVTKTVNYLNNF